MKHEFSWHLLVINHKSAWTYSQSNKMMSRVWTVVMGRKHGASWCVRTCLNSSGSVDNICEKKQTNQPLFWKSRNPKITHAQLTDPSADNMQSVSGLPDWRCSRDASTWSPSSVSTWAGDTFSGHNRLSRHLFLKMDGEGNAASLERSQEAIDSSCQSKKNLL